MVAVIDIGGLGHLSIEFARALGAEVHAFSRTSSKRDETIGFGAGGFSTTQKDKDSQKTCHYKFDLNLNCASSVDVCLGQILELLEG